LAALFIYSILKGDTKKNKRKEDINMKFIYRMIFSITVMIIFSYPPEAKSIHYNHESITINELIPRVDFTILRPTKVPKEWTLEIKNHPDNSTKEIKRFSLHYMDEVDEELMIGIEETKASKEFKTELENEVSKEDKLKINGCDAYFLEWGNSGQKLNGKTIRGGLLAWTQEGTYVEFESSTLTKEKMIEIAESMVGEN
jgi:hypothetical protein